MAWLKIFKFSNEIGLKVFGWWVLCYVISWDICPVGFYENNTENVQVDLIFLLTELYEEWKCHNLCIWRGDRRHDRNFKFRNGNFLRSALGMCFEGRSMCEVYWNNLTVLLHEWDLCGFFFFLGNFIIFEAPFIREFLIDVGSSIWKKIESLCGNHYYYSDWTRSEIDLDYLHLAYF